MDSQPLPDSWADTHGSWVAWWIPAIVAAVLVGVALARRRGALDALGMPARSRLRLLGAAALVAACALSAANYVDFGAMRYGTYLNEWACFHYYLGSKYSPELEYEHLYDAAIVASVETGQARAGLPRGIRDLRTAGLVRTSAVLAGAPAIKRRFSADRWREFSADVRFFREQLPPDRWNRVFEDHGYNATPTWSLAVRALTSVLSIRSPVSRAILLAIDPALLALALVAIARAFRPRIAALALILLGTHYLMSWGHMKGMIARTDFAVASVLSVCFLEKKRFGAAGACLAWASLSRVFPLLFVIGPAIQFLDEWRRNGRPSREWTRFFVVYVGTALVAIGVTFVFYDGPSMWMNWGRKIVQHYLIRSDWNVGYQVLVDARFVRGIPQIVHAPVEYAHDEAARVARAVALWIPRLTICIPAAYFARSMRPSDALSFGFVFIFMLVSATYYYYLVLLVPFLFMARRVDDVVGAVGTGLFLVVGSLGYLLFSGVSAAARSVPMLAAHHQQYPTYYAMSALVGLTVVYMIFVGAREAHAIEAPRATTGDAPVSAG